MRSEREPERQQHPKALKVNEDKNKKGVDRWSTPSRIQLLQPADKPNSVPSTRAPCGALAQETTIPLGPRSLTGSSDLPGGFGRAVLNATLFGLAPCGVLPATRVATGAVRSYRTFSPLLASTGLGPAPAQRALAGPAAPKRVSAKAGGMFSVPLSFRLP